MSPHPLLLLGCLLLGGCTALGKIGQVVMNPSIPVGGPGDQPSQFSLSLYASPTVNINPLSAPNPGEAYRQLPPAPLAISLSATDPQELTRKLQAALDRMQQDYPAMSTTEFDQADDIAMSPVAPELGVYDAPYLYLGIPQTESASSPEEVTTPVAFKVLQLKDDSLLLNAPYELLAQDLKKTLGTTLVQVDDYRLLPGQFKFVGFEEIDKATRYLAVIADYQDRDTAFWKRALRIEPRGHQHAVLIQFEDDGVVLKGEG